MANGGFESMFIQLDAWGLSDAILPFLLIFTLIFATLNRTKIVGDTNKRIHFIIAFVIAWLVVLPHLTGRYPPGQDVITIINTALPNVAVVLVAIVTILLLVGLFSPTSLVGSPVTGLFALVSIGFVVYFFGQAAGIWSELPPALNFLNDADTQALLIILTVFGLVLFFITRDDSGGAHVGGGFGSLLNGLRDMITPK